MKNKKLMSLTGASAFMLAGFFQNFIVFSRSLFQLIAAGVLAPICLILFGVQFWLIFIKK